jgi:hypothetical protein
LKEIELKEKINVSKIIYSKGSYHKFSITARSYKNAAKDFNEKEIID